MCTHAGAFIFLYCVTLSKVQKYFKTDFFKRDLKWLWNKRKENRKKKNNKTFLLFPHSFWPEGPALPFLPSRGPARGAAQCRPSPTAPPFPSSLSDQRAPFFPSLTGRTHRAAPVFFLPTVWRPDSPQERNPSR